MTASSDPASAPLDLPVPPAELAPPLPAATAGAAWPAWQRFLFRYAALHWLLYAFPRPLDQFLGAIARGLLAVAKTWEGLGIDMQAAPWKWPGKWASELGDVHEIWVREGGQVVGGRGFWQQVTSWLSERGWTPWPVVHQPTGSGDTAHDWVRFGVVVIVALVLATTWTLLSRARAHQRLGRWLHLLVRWDLALWLLSYGFAKFCGGQFGQLELMRLTQEIGDTSPMGLVGTFQQASKPYELFGGAGEVLGGLLLFHRRTALLGLFVAIPVLTNIAALNWLCGVPVKLFSAHLLLYAIALLAPFAPAMWAVCVRNTGSQPVDLAVVKRPWLAWPLYVVGGLWVATTCTFAVVDTKAMHARFTAGRDASPLYGYWLVERMLLDGVEVPLADASRWRAFAVDRGRNAWAQEATGRRVFFDFALELPAGAAPGDAAAAPTAGTVQVKSRAVGGGEANAWSFELGHKTLPVDPPLLLKNEDRRRKVDGERRTLVLRGNHGGKALELHTVQKQFRLQAPFRLRQELPEGW